jgi:hypothetical protein
MKAIHARHHGVEQDEVRQVVGCHLQRGFPGLGIQRGVAFRLEQGVEEAAVFGVVVDHQDGFSRVYGLHVNSLASMGYRIVPC